MIVSYFGDGTFRLQNGETSVLIDSQNNRLKADVYLKTLATPEIPSSENEIFAAGEYELKGVEVQGWELNDESGDKFIKTVYLIRWEDIKIAALGHVSGAISGDILDHLSDADILILPAGGGNFLTAEAAAKLAKQLEPAIVIPSFIKDGKDFLKAIGQKAETEEKFVFKKKDLVPGAIRAVVLAANSEK